MTIISDSRALEAFCARQQGADFVAVDTEFMRERTYWPILCLVQVAGPEEAAAIDALAPDIDLGPLLALMAAPHMLKVFHAARQDVEIFFNLMGAVPAPLFDTQVAAMVCGFGDAASYETLVAKYSPPLRPIIQRVTTVLSISNIGHMRKRHVSARGRAAEEAELRYLRATPLPDTIPSRLVEIIIRRCGAVGSRTSRPAVEKGVRAFSLSPFPPYMATSQLEGRREQAK